MAEGESKRTALISPFRQLAQINQYMPDVPSKGQTSCVDPDQNAAFDQDLQCTICLQEFLFEIKKNEKRKPDTRKIGKGLLPTDKDKDILENDFKEHFRVPYFWKFIWHF